MLPEVPYRQWVLTFPRRVRFALLEDAQLLAQVVRLFARRVWAWQRREARARGVPDGLGGAVAFLQRFGSNLGANLHVHAVFPEGVFLDDTADSPLSFVPLSAPSDAQVVRLLEQIARRVERCLAQRQAQQEHADQSSDALDPLRASSLRPRPWGHLDAPDQGATVRSRRCAFLQGYSLHANRRVLKHDRQGLETLLRYATRPALALERLELLADGHLRYRIKRSFEGAPHELRLEPTELLRKLAVLIPPPRQHQARYLGVLSSHSKHRARVVPQVQHDAVAGSTPGSPPQPEPEVPASAPPGAPESPPRAGRLDWRTLLQRVFKFDVLSCRRCSGRLRVLAVIMDPFVVRRILEHLRLPADPPQVAPARGPPQMSFDDLGDAGFVDPSFSEISS